MGRSLQLKTSAKEHSQAAIAKETGLGVMILRGPLVATFLALFLMCATTIVFWYGDRLTARPIGIYYTDFPSKFENSDGGALEGPRERMPSKGVKVGVNRTIGDNKVYRLEVVKRYPHDHKAFTQGLIYLGKDTLYESTGLRGQSTVRKVDLQTGRVLTVHNNKGHDFGEGLAYYKGFFWQLIWQKRTVYQYDVHTLEVVGTHSMPNDFDFDDGWGLASTSDGLAQFYPPGKVPIKEEALYVTDSGTKLYRVDFSDGTFKLNRAVTIRTPQGRALEMANELEVIDRGEIWANVYGKDCIARINPDTGRMFGWILADNLRRERIGWGVDVFNGIAYDRSGDRVFVTGKLWHMLFEVRLVPDSTVSDDWVQRLCVPLVNSFRR